MFETEVGVNPSVATSVLALLQNIKRSFKNLEGTNALAYFAAFFVNRKKFIKNTLSFFQQMQQYYLLYHLIQFKPS
jgi:hypothetical protein